MKELLAMSKENEAKAMNAFCPNCEKDTEQKFVDKVEEISIRGEMIPIHMEYYHCEECGEDFEIPRPDYDPLDAAYREYRNIKGMVQPEEIKKFRKELGLTQKELSEILGIGIATLNVVPTCSFDSKVMVPFNISTYAFEIAKPNPNPSLAEMFFELILLNRLKTFN